MPPLEGDDTANDMEKVDWAEHKRKITNIDFEPKMFGEKIWKI
jgi:hypothetical protein